MFTKIILIILIAVFVIYLWNSYTEGLYEEDNTFQFTLADDMHGSMYHDGLFFKVATILSDESYTRTSEDKISFSSLFAAGVTDPDYAPLRHEAIELKKKTDPEPSEPYFTIDNDGSISIHNVKYVTGVSDKYKYSCDGVTDDDIGTLITNGPLFTNRICAFIKVNKASDSTDLSLIPGENPTENVHLAKLSSTVGERNKFTMIFLESDSELSLMEEDEGTFILYIYEGFDIAPQKSYEDLYTLTCADIVELFLERRGGVKIPTRRDELKVSPRYKYYNLMDYIYTDVAKGNDNNKRLTACTSPTCDGDVAPGFLSLLIGGSVVIPAASKSITNYFKNVKMNIVLFHIHLTGYSQGAQLLEYITLDLNMHNIVINDIKASRTYKEKLKDFYSSDIGNLKGGAWSDDIRVPKELITIIEDPGLGMNNMYLRIPDYSHLCGVGSENNELLRNMTVQLADDKINIISSNACAYSQPVRMIQREVRSDKLAKFNNLIDKDGKRSYILNDKIDVTSEVLTY